jgi:hypothetical protein
VSVDWQGPAWLRRPAEALGVGIYNRATRLSLQGPKYDDAAVEHLLKLRSLNSLTLERTQFSDEGLARLSRLLPNCRVERRL